MTELQKRIKAATFRRDFIDTMARRYTDMPDFDTEAGLMLAGWLVELNQALAAAVQEQEPAAKPAPGAKQVVVQ